MKVKLLSRVWLFVTPLTVVYQAPPSMGFSRQGYWSGLPFPSPENLPEPGIEPGSPTLKADTKAYCGPRVVAHINRKDEVTVLSFLNGFEIISRIWLDGENKKSILSKGQEPDSSLEAEVSKGLWHTERQWHWAWTGWLYCVEKLTQ